MIDKNVKNLFLLRVGDFSGNNINFFGFMQAVLVSRYFKQNGIMLSDIINPDKSIYNQMSGIISLCMKIGQIDSTRKKLKFTKDDTTEIDITKTLCNKNNLLKKTNFVLLISDKLAMQKYLEKQGIERNFEKTPISYGEMFSLKAQEWEDFYSDSNIEYDEILPTWKKDFYSLQNMNGLINFFNNSYKPDSLKDSINNLFSNAIFNSRIEKIVNNTMKSFTK